MKSLLNVIAVLGFATLTSASVESTRSKSKWLFGTGKLCSTIRDTNECMRSNNFANWADKCLPIKKWGWFGQTCSNLWDTKIWR